MNNFQTKAQTEEVEARLGENLIRIKSNVG